MRISIASSYPRGLPAVQPLQPAPAVREQQERGGGSRARPAPDKLPAAAVRAESGQLRQTQQLAFRPDSMDPHSRHAIQAYRALEDSELQRQLSQLLGIDEYA